MADYALAAVYVALVVIEFIADQQQYDFQTEKHRRLKEGLPLEQYEKGGHGVINEDPNILPFKLSDRDKKDLIAFLNMLSDPSFINNKDFSNPF
jgi:hypothetical protein